MSTEKQISDAILTVVKREKFTVSWLEGNVLRIDVHESAFLELEDIQEIQMQKALMTKGALYCVLFVCPHFGNLSKESREYLALPETNVNAVAKAVITPNLGTRMLTDFSFSSINHPFCTRPFQT
ncbi:MAG: hypothetical protein IPO32_00875 [Crocinitomicaceae bacterium]|nr:hypothetical protein [Crocinitomicaceae bacterium]